MAVLVAVLYTFSNLSAENEISYDTLQFYNAALAIFAGCAAASLSFYLLPPLSPVLRARRLLYLAVRDLRACAISPDPPTPDDWEQRMYSLLAALPDKAEPLQRTQLLAALTVGSEVIQLRTMASRLPLVPELNAALASLAKANIPMAVTQFGRLEQRLAAVPRTEPTAQLTLRARASILAITETIGQHAAYFAAGEPA